MLQVLPLPASHISLTKRFTDPVTYTWRCSNPDPVNTRTASMAVVLPGGARVTLAPTQAIGPGATVDVTRAWEVTLLNNAWGPGLNSHTLAFAEIFPDSTFATFATHTYEVTANPLQLDIGNTTAAPGTIAAIPVSFEGAAKPIRAFEIRFTYSGAVIPTATATRGPGTPAAWLFSQNSPAPGDLRVIAFDPSGTGANISGALVQLNLTVAPGAALGPVPISVSLVDFRDSVSTVVPITVINGTVTVGTPVTEQQIVLAVGQDLIHGFTFARGMLWATTTTSPGLLLRFTQPLTDLSIYDVLTFPNDGLHNSPATVVYNPTLDRLHVLFSHPSNTNITTVNPVDLTFRDISVPFTPCPSWGALAVANDRLCVLTRGQPARLMTINMVTETIIEIVTLPMLLLGHALVFDGISIYGAGRDSQFPAFAHIFKANPNSLGDASFDSGIVGSVAFFADDLAILAGRVWLPTESPRVGEILGAPLTNIHTWLIASTGFVDAGSFGVASDGTNVWSSWSMAPGVQGTLTAHNPINGALIHTHLFPPGFESTNEIAFTPDGNAAFVTFWLAPARLARFPNPLPH